MVLVALKHQEIKLKKEAKKACNYVQLIRLLFAVDIADDTKIFTHKYCVWHAITN